MKLSSSQLGLPGMDSLAWQALGPLAVRRLRLADPGYRMFRLPRLGKVQAGAARAAAEEGAKAGMKKQTAIRVPRKRTAEAKSA